ncbi:MAG TPA: hypothetical protein VK658_07330 [Chryseolinea sp.]|nr:hypothetical protein [Chryseolinea sp.]
MQVKVKTLHAMIDMLVDQTECSRDFSGFRAMSEKMGLSNSHYLYKKVHLRIRDQPETAIVRLNEFSLNAIAEYLNYDSFRNFELSLHYITPQIQSLMGSYYCYVRANLPDATVLRSPVQIFELNGKPWFELRGPKIQYKGEVSLKEGCLFVLMTSKAGKVFHHVYKIGTRHEPNVLQGVFSGVSTAFDPIGGRAVLIRENEGGAKLRNAMISVSDLRKSKNRDEHVLGKYFAKYENNNVAPAKSATFGIQDLI